MKHTEAAWVKDRKILNEHLCKITEANEKYNDGKYMYLINDKNPKNNDGE